MKLLAFLAAALLAASAPAWAAAPTKPKPKPAAPARVVLPTTVRPERYDIRIRPDAQRLSFTGHANIAVRVVRPTDRIVLNAADLKFARVTLPGHGAPRIVLDDDEQTASFVFAKPLAPGRYELSIDYTGRIYEQASGFFALDYDTPAGRKRALFTQFENSDARRFAPMWDEPGVKAVFSLTVDVPAAEMAVSNMPVAATAPAEPGRKEVRFADSPKMSSYLLFFGLGDFERIHRQVGPTDVGVIVRRGDTAKGEYALDAAGKLLGFYNDYFATPYPLPKLDLIAGPGRSQFFGAMENWGAIFYFDYELLLDPKLSTEQNRQNVFVVIAHEMAHQWFGDLVTMAWWDDLWLNEGFASWMENKATDHFHPEWKIWLQSASGQQNAMRLDARAGTHPIITPIRDVFAASNAFDGITYEKGQAVIRMLESYVGEDVFRAGVRNYIAHHRYGNTVTDDLWREVDAVSPRKITEIAHDFTLQAGVPLIQVEAIRMTPTQSGIRLTQGRFGADDSQKAPRTWRTPVTVGGIGEPWRTIVSAARPVQTDTGSRTTPALNWGQTGYYRSSYLGDLWADQVVRFPIYPPADQLVLLFDSRALGEAGYGPMSRLLDLSIQVTPESEPVVQKTLAEQLEAWNGYYAEGGAAAAYRGFARARLAPLFARLGWEPRPGESDNDAVLRATLQRILGAMDDPAVLAEARRRFQASLTRPESLTGSTREAVLRIVGAHANAAAWEQLHALARASTDATDRPRLYRYLGAANDPTLADRTLALALSGEPKATEAPGIIAAVAEVFPDRAYDFALAHRAQVEALLEPTSRMAFFTRLASGSRDPAMLTKLAAFARTAPASTVGEVRKSEAAIRIRLEVIGKRLPDLDRWLAAHRG